jgi:hypothetical protein
MFMGEARSPPKSGAPERCSTLLVKIRPGLDVIKLFLSVIYELS